MLLHGQAAPNPVISALHFFRPEFERHYRDHVCDAGICRFDDPKYGDEPAHEKGEGAHA